jgi:hypothetical protein
MLKDIVLVIGMHRSGTSLTTRIVNIMGYTIGNEADIIEADAGNPTGYWEHRSFVSLNRKLLAAYLMPKVVSNFLFPKLKQKAAELILSFKDCSRIVLKDPIASITLPFWVEVIKTCLSGNDVKISTIICVRNPLDVSKSLQNRGLFLKNINCRLWEKYLSSAIKNSDGLPRHIIHYEHYFDEHCDAAIPELGGFLDANLNAGRINEIKQFINPALRESNIGNRIWSYNLSRNVKALYKVLYSDMTSQNKYTV